MMAQIRDNSGLPTHQPMRVICVTKEGKLNMKAQN